MPESRTGLMAPTLQRGSKPVTLQRHEYRRFAGDRGQHAERGTDHGDSRGQAGDRTTARHPGGPQHAGRLRADGGLESAAGTGLAGRPPGADARPHRQRGPLSARRRRSDGGRAGAAHGAAGKPGAASHEHAVRVDRRHAGSSADRQPATRWCRASPPMPPPKSASKSPLESRRCSSP